MQSQGKEGEVISSDTPNILKRYTDYLKHVYNCDRIARDDKLAISPCKDFITLALVNKQQSHHDDPFSKSTFHGGVDQILDTRTSLDLDTLVAPGLQFHLVEGPPGIGKSTMCWELCRKWETLKSLQDFKIVLRLKLREKRVQNATSLHQLFYHDDQKLCEGIVDLVLSCDGEGVLLVLDGFDELPSSVVSDESSLIMRLIRGHCLPKTTRLVTSRPSALNHKDTCFPQEYQHTEILGFTNKYKIEFAEEAFKAEPEILTQFIKFIFSNPIITSLMYIPVNCAIIAQVYKDFSDIKVPKTMTQLYTSIVLVLIRRHLIQTGRWTVQSEVPDNLEGLPEDIRTDLMRVSELASQGLLKEDIQIVFTGEDVGENFELLGLLNEAKEMYVSKGPVTYYSFLHLSIQEFLAAWYISHHSHLFNPLPLCCFMLTDVTMIPSLTSFGRFISGMCNFMNDIIEVYFGSPSILVPWCYEAQDISCLKFEHCRIDIDNPLDMYMFGYCLVYAPVKWTLTAMTPLDMLVSSVKDHAPDVKNVLGSIVTLNTSISSITDLKFFPTYLLGSILILYLDWKDYFSEEENCIQALVNMTNLNTLFCCFRDVSVETVESLCHFMANSSTLECIMLSPCLKLGYYSTSCSGMNWTSPGRCVWNYQKLVKAALSCSTLEKFTTIVPFNAYNLSSSVYEVNYVVDRFDYLVVTEFDCLCNIADLCKSLSTVRIINRYFQALELPSKLLCTFLAIFQSSLNSNPSLNVDIVPPFNLSLSDLPSLSCALRKDPDVAHLNLRRSKSLSDLTALRVKRSTLKSAERLSWQQSCPDLLEMQSLRNMHFKLREAVNAKQFYYDPKNSGNVYGIEYPRIMHKYNLVKNITMLP